MTDRELIRVHWPPALRPAFDALFAIDDALGEVVAGSSQPMLAAIKLAWWRERLEELDRGIVPAEPRLLSAFEILLPHGVTGHEIAQIEAGWAALIEDDVDRTAFRKRGEALFAIGARLLGMPGADLADAGGLWAEIDVARRLGKGLPGLKPLPPSHIPRTQIPRTPGPLRPLTMFAALARRDALRGPPFEAEATPGRSWTLIRHRFSGRW